MPIPRLRLDKEVEYFFISKMELIKEAQGVPKPYKVDNKPQ